MTTRYDFDTRPIMLVDIPLVKRLLERGVVLDSELEFTRNAHGPDSAVLSKMLLQRELYTLITRAGKQQVVGQFRLRPDALMAHLVYMAPGLEVGTDDTAWLHTLDAMAREAGKAGAHALVAEVGESSVLFETMRAAGYAVYARQEIWRREASTLTAYEAPVDLVEATESDIPAVQSLFANTVPSLMQQCALPSMDMRGLIYRRGGRVEAFIAYGEGRHGIYLIPYLHPDLLPDAPAIFEAALRQLSHSAKVPVYVCVRRYQDWMTEPLAELAFEPYTQQAVMVKYMTVGVRYTTFASPSLATPRIQIERSRIPAKTPMHFCQQRER